MYYLNVPSIFEGKKNAYRKIGKRGYMLCWFFILAPPSPCMWLSKNQNAYPRITHPIAMLNVFFRAVAAIMKYLFWNSFGFGFTFLKKGRKFHFFLFYSMRYLLSVCIICTLMRKYKRKNHTTSLWNREKSLNFFYIASYTFYI